MHRFIFLIILSFFIALVANAQNDKVEAYNKVLEKYGELATISLKFKSLDNSKLEGSIEAKSGNKYVLRMGSRIITCNGKTIWNYSIDDNNVIVSKFDPSLHSNSIEKLFFSLIESFSPTELKKESSSKGTSFTMLTLANKDNNAKFEFDAIKLWLNSSYEIESFSLMKKKSEERWAISNLTTNKKISDKTFNFTPPKGAEIIDLR